MKKLFKLNNYELELTEELLQIPQTAEILSLKFNKQEGDNDGRKRKRGYSILRYASLFYAYNSPLAEQPDKKRKEMAIKYSQINVKDLNNSTVIEFLKEIETLSVDGSKSLQALIAARNLIDKMIEHINNVDFNDVDEHGKPLYDINKYKGFIKDLDGLIEGLDKLEDKVTSSLAQTTRARGGAKIGNREDIRRN